jgi:hypothetical protein
MSGVGVVVLNRKLLLPSIVFAAFWVLAITFWLTSGYLQALLLFGYIGTALAVGLGPAISQDCTFCVGDRQEEQTY